MQTVPLRSLQMERRRTAEGNWREMWNQGKLGLFSFRVVPPGQIGVQENLQEKQERRRRCGSRPLSPVGPPQSEERREMLGKSM